MMMNAMRCTRISRVAALRRDGGVGLGRLAHFCVPNRPAGRNSSTMAMMTKITVFDASG